MLFSTEGRQRYLARAAPIRLRSPRGSLESVFSRYGFDVMRQGVQRRFSRVYPQFRPPGLFDLVADIESYPPFVPGCLKRGAVARDNVLLVDNGFCARPLRQKFLSRATLDRRINYA